MIYHNAIRMSILFLILAIPACFNGNKVEPSTGLFVINVLDKDLYDDCHITGSQNVLLEDVDNFAQKLAKDAEIVIYCSNYMCTASGMVAKQLKAQGFTRVYAYEAGMAEWYQMKLPVEGTCKKAYLNKTISSSSDHDNDVTVITTEALYDKMKNMKLFE